MDFAGLVTPLTRQTLSVDVYRQLRDLLMNGRVMPGEQLSLRSIAEGLGVSVMPVREAVHRLVAEQALELTANRTLRVPVMTVSQFREITSIRINLEGLATSRAAALADDAGLAAIESLHDRFDREMSLKRIDESRLISLNKDLHFSIYRQAGMPMLVQMIESMWLRIGPILNYDMRSGTERITERVQLSHHDRMVKGLRKRSATEAVAGLKGDIQSAADFIISAGLLVTADAPAVQAPALPAGKAARKRTAG